jgi:hypothetical protein
MLAQGLAGRFSAHRGVPASVLFEALNMAGFTEIAVVWRYMDYSVVAAIR